MIRLFRRLFRIHEEDTILGGPLFRDNPSPARRHLGTAGRAFLDGYHLALEHPDFPGLAAQLDGMAPALRGFAYEGAAMAVALLDMFRPWGKSRLLEMAGGIGGAHVYLIHVGAGWVLARKPCGTEKFLARFDPLLRWLVLDGYGFHEGFFHADRCLQGQPVPARIPGYGRRAFDQGLGRSFWFLKGGDVPEISGVVARFPEARRGDLWSGIGLAAVYAGGVGAADLRQLRKDAGEYTAELAQGAAFAAKARQRAGTIDAYVDQACEILCQRPAMEAAAVTDEALIGLPFDQTQPAYEHWRERIRRQLSPSLLTSP